MSENSLPLLLKCEVFYNPFRISHNIQGMVSDFFFYIKQKEL